MKRFYISKEDLLTGIIQGDEYNHLKNVLRMAIGDQFIAICNDEYNYICEIMALGKNSGTFKVLRKELNTSNPKINITLIQALAKGEKLELIAQKASEMGATSLVPIYLKNCDVKQNTGKLSRLYKIAIGASKQCGRSTILNITDCITIKQLPELFKTFDLVIFANEREDNTSLHQVLSKTQDAKNIAILIGPEGGFAPQEIEHINILGATSVSLGSRILRTETASLYTLAVVSDYYKN